MTRLESTIHTHDERPNDIEGPIAFDTKDSRYPVLVRKLLHVLEHAQNNLAAEIRPDQPKTILTHVEDLARNLPDWLESLVAKMDGQYRGPITECLKPFGRLVLNANEVLLPLADGKILHSKNALAQLEILHKGISQMQNEIASVCELKLSPRVSGFRDKLAAVRALSEDCSETERDLAECDLCLASRGAYFDFYTWVVIHSEIDEWAKRVLGELLKESVDVLRIKKYQASVKIRYHEFKNVCKRVENGESVASF